MSTFTEVTADEQNRLIDANALVWIVPHAAPTLALLMPIIRDGEPGRLLGHLPKRHPAALALAQDGRAQLLLLGPNAVVTSEVARIAAWAPTWNFVSASIEVDIRLDDALTTHVLAATVAHLDPAWDAAGLGARHAKMASQVIGFVADIVAAQPRFKLGQDERPEVRARIAEHFADTPPRSVDGTHRQALASRGPTGCLAQPPSRIAGPSPGPLGSTDAGDRCDPRQE